MTRTRSFIGGGHAPTQRCRSTPLQQLVPQFAIAKIYCQHSEFTASYNLGESSILSLSRLGEWRLLSDSRLFSIQWTVEIADSFVRVLIVRLRTTMAAERQARSLIYTAASSRCRCRSFHSVCRGCTGDSGMFASVRPGHQRFFVSSLINNPLALSVVPLTAVTPIVLVCDTLTNADAEKISSARLLTCYRSIKTYLIYNEW